MTEVLYGPETFPRYKVGSINYFSTKNKKVFFQTDMSCISPPKLAATEQIRTDGPKSVGHCCCGDEFIIPYHITP